MTDSNRFDNNSRQNRSAFDGSQLPSANFDLHKMFHWLVYSIRNRRFNTNMASSRFTIGDTGKCKVGDNALLLWLTALKRKKIHFNFNSNIFITPRNSSKSLVKLFKFLIWHKLNNSYSKKLFWAFGGFVVHFCDKKFNEANFQEHFTPLNCPLTCPLIYIFLPPQRRNFQSSNRTYEAIYVHAFVILIKIAGSRWNWKKNKQKCNNTLKSTNFQATKRNEQVYKIKIPLGKLFVPKHHFPLLPHGKNVTLRWHFHPWAAIIALGTLSWASFSRSWLREHEKMYLMIPSAKPYLGIKNYKF